MVHARFFFRQLVLLILLLSPLAASAGIIVNRDAEGRSISVATLRNIYTLRQTLWPDRQPIAIFVLPDDIRRTWLSPRKSSDSIPTAWAKSGTG